MRRPMRASGFSDPNFARLADLAHLLAGLVFPPNRQPSAEAGMRRAMATLHISDPAALLRATETRGPARDVVLGELTVGESYFFRDAAQLSVLATDILPTRLASADKSSSLRVWSAGCASGEEPHTVAILLRELGWPYPAHILGTDVAIPRLEAARRGRYTRWALRGVSEERVAKWFHRRGDHFELDRTVRESVEFRALNLVHDDYSTAKQDTEGFDLVLCRNVMIYFDMPTVTRIAAGLLDSLATDGWLVLGASDPPLAQLVPCEVVMTPTGIAYRRPDPSGAPHKRIAYVPRETPRFEDVPVLRAPLPSPVTPPDAPMVEPRRSEPRRSEPSLRRIPLNDVPVDATLLDTYERADYPGAESMAIDALAAAVEGEDTLVLWIHYIRAVANQGRLHEAGELCARALETHPLSAELHCLHATLLTEAGWHADAAIAARRSIYLDRTFVMGHLLLGDALTRTSDSNGARIAFENAIALLAKVDDTVKIAAADGVPVARLRQIATLRLRTLTATRR